MSSAPVSSDDTLRQRITRAFHDRDGYTVDDIAEAAGLSRARIYQIVGEAERDDV
jgi:DNA-directed RNA polymerase sigma subunit (sigma70/sigma32)